jgi:hypothetical protein
MGEAGGVMEGLDPSHAATANAAHSTSATARR